MSPLVAKMKILFVHEVDWHDKPIFEMHEFPEDLVRRGHDVVFMDYQESEPGKLSALRRRNAGRRWLEVALTRISIRTPIGGIAGRLIAVPWSWLVSGIVLRSRPWDVIVLYAVPTNGWSVAWWAKRLRIPTVYRAIDVSHQLRETHFASWVRRAERYVARSVTHISTHNTALGDYLMTLSGRAKSYSIELPGIELAKPSQETIDRMRCEFGLTGVERVILYRGTMYRFAGLVDLVELLRPHLHRSAGLRLLIVGGGEAVETVRTRVRELDLLNSVIIRPFVPHEDLGALFALADVCVNPFEPNLVTNCALPGRVLQSLLSGTPCVSTPLKGLRSMIDGVPGLHFVEMGPEFVDALMKYVDESLGVSAQQIELCTTSGDSFDWAAVGEAFEVMLKSVVEA